MNFSAEVRQVKTMCDGTVNVTLNLPEYHLGEAQQLLAMIGEMVTCAIAGCDDDRRQSSDDSRLTTRKGKR